MLRFDVHEFTATCRKKHGIPVREQEGEMVGVGVGKRGEGGGGEKTLFCIFCFLLEGFSKWEGYQRNYCCKCGQNPERFDQNWQHSCQLSQHGTSDQNLKARETIALEDGESGIYVYP